MGNPDDASRRSGAGAGVGLASRQEPRRNPLLPETYDAIAPSTRPPRRRSAPARRTSKIRQIVVPVMVVPTLMTVFLTWSVIGALMTPGNQGFSAKWADWLRANHAAVIVNQAEAWYYSLGAPAKGGRPKHLNALPSSSRAVPSTTRPAGGTRRRLSHLHRPKPVPLVVSPALRGEGQWQAVGPRIDGVAGMYEAQFRADTVYTSEITSAVWIDPLVMHLALVPGQTEPGGSWSIPPYVTNAERASVDAAFNGGFRFADAKGGFYLDGRTAVPLRRGAASLVIYRNGRVNVGAWGSEVAMTPSVVAVLQNLVPMVDHGRVSPSTTNNDSSVWGATLGATTVVARSGIGITADGAVVYVAGPALTARTLAESLQRAGAVRAMTLDINPEWVTFNFFSHPDASNPSLIKPSSLYPQMQRPSDRYLGPTLEARDFFTVAQPSSK